ncbi:hypothetical protein AAFM71_19075 [Chromobacterium violaceum]|uniref:hypothetical protein n=1 Tax=Chromobacterium violaceum TaxID=536 RepID=UPI00385C7C6A
MVKSKVLCGLLSFSIVVSSLSGCATANVPSQKDANKSKIDSIKTVDIYYHKTDYAVMDLGGSGMSGLGGMFGVVGLLASLGAHAASKLTASDRADVRSHEFSELMRAHESDIDQDQASKLAEFVASTGRKVKLVEIDRPLGEKLVWKPAASDSKEEGSAALLLRTSLGYGAESMTSSYKPVVVTEYVLQTGNGDILVDGKETLWGDGPTYMTYDGLKKSYDAVHVALKTDSLSVAQKIFHATLEK